MAVIYFHKDRGETMGQMMNRFREQYPDHTRATYAGRLDPLASGQVVILTENDVHHKDTYTNRDKIYEVDIVFGVSSDTYDALGVVSGVDVGSTLNQNQIVPILDSYIGDYEQSYPVYSSRTVNGKPLWHYAQQGLLDTITVPRVLRHIYEYSYDGVSSASRDEMIRGLFDDMNRIEGDFRQQQIYDSWQGIQVQLPENLHIHTLNFTVSSGTYIREIVHRLGQDIGCGAIAMHIRRIGYKD